MQPGDLVVHPQPALLLHHLALARRAIWSSMVQRAHPVRLEVEHRLQRLGGEVVVVHGDVVGGVGVGAAAVRLQHLVELLGAVLLRPVEHHVLEEVADAGDARALVARAHPEEGVEAHHRRVVVGHQPDPRPLGSGPPGRGRAQPGSFASAHGEGPAYRPLGAFAPTSRAFRGRRRTRSRTRRTPPHAVPVGAPGGTPGNVRAAGMGSAAWAPREALRRAGLCPSCRSSVRSRSSSSAMRSSSALSSIRPTRARAFTTRATLPAGASSRREPDFPGNTPTTDAPPRRPCPLPEQPLHGGLQTAPRSPRPFAPRKRPSGCPPMPSSPACWTGRRGCRWSAPGRSSSTATCAWATSSWSASTWTTRWPSTTCGGSSSCRST